MNNISGKENQINNDQNQDYEGEDLFNENEEIEYTNSGGQNEDDDLFDNYCGALQDIVIDPEFEVLQNEFCEKNCLEFDDDEENKFEYTIIFKEYQTMLEKHIESKLEELVPGYNMKKFHQLLETRIDEIDPQILDLLMTCSDFVQFKEHMLSFKKIMMSKKKKSKKVQEAGLANNVKKTMDKKPSFEDAFDELMISGTPKVINKASQMPSNHVNPPAPKKTVSTKNPPPVAKKVTKKASFDGDKVPLTTPKQTNKKGNNDYVPNKKGSIFN